MSFTGIEIEGNSNDFLLIIDNISGEARLERQCSTINLKAHRNISFPINRVGSGRVMGKFIKPS